MSHFLLNISFFWIADVVAIVFVHYLNNPFGYRRVAVETGCELKDYGKGFDIGYSESGGRTGQNRFNSGLDCCRFDVAHSDTGPRCYLESVVRCGLQ